MQETRLAIKKENGFIALVSAIIMSAAILIIITALSLNGFYDRGNILDSELKERSLSHAEACIDYGIFLISTNVVHLSTTSMPVGQYQCALGPIPGPTPYSGVKIFYTQASTSNYFTTLKVSVDSGTFETTSYEEITTY